MWETERRDKRKYGYDSNRGIMCVCVCVCVCVSVHAYQEGSCQPPLSLSPRPPHSFGPIHNQATHRQRKE